jgi:N-acetylglucosamine kinase-like BadF-type ATPase
MDAILGIDGGGTRTRASIVAGERVLAHAENGSIKRLRVGAEAAETHLRALLKDVYAQAGVTGVRAASAGVASAAMPGVTEWIDAVFQDFNVERSEVVGDEVIALDAAFRGGPGFCRSPEPARTPLAARRTAAGSARAAGVRTWATRDRATGSGCIACGER